MPGRRLLNFTDPRVVIGKQHCCELMTGHVTYRCAEHPDPFECGDNVVYYAPAFDEYGLIIHTGSSDYFEIHYCPWCGSRLPESRREQWFEILKALGYQDPLGEDIPDVFLTDEWYTRQQP